MKLEIPGTASDYVTEQGKDCLGKNYKANRAKIRDLVRIHGEAIRDVIADGSNVHTANLDFNDQIAAFIAELPVEAQSIFYDVLTEEINAQALSTKDKTNEINAKIAADAEFSNNVGLWIGAAILLVVVLFFFGVI